MRFWQGIVFMAICSMLMACGKTQPQRPTFKNRPQAADSTVVALVEVNQRMAADADSRLARYATEDYALQEEGYWVSGLHDIETGFSDSTQVCVRMQVYDTEGNLYEDRHETFCVGKTGDMRVLDPVLRQLHRGDSVSILAPWYMAYGSLGSQVVPPYTNVRIELRVF
ncbi:MAG: hypothetical protein IJU36_01130 [Paludibacteraceae bacterium]|nr:hypothetical protein [Paludibacteraceae bacterium]